MDIETSKLLAREMTLARKNHDMEELQKLRELAEKEEKIEE